MNLQEVASIAKSMNLKVTGNEFYKLIDNGHAFVVIQMDTEDTYSEEQSEKVISAASKKIMEHDFRYLDLMGVDEDTTEQDIKTFLDEHLIHEPEIDLNQLDPADLLTSLGIKITEPYLVRDMEGNRTWYQYIHLVDTKQGRLNVRAIISYATNTDSIQYRVVKMNTAGPAQKVVDKMIDLVIRADRFCKKIKEEFLKDHSIDLVITLNESI